MEQAYAENLVKRKQSIGSIIIKVFAIIFIVLLVLATPFFKPLLIAALILAGILIWYWPRFKVQWEYIYCDGQLDFDQILGEEKRKNALRIEIENADVIAPIKSSRLDGYRHLEEIDYTSKQEDAIIYGIATRLPDKEDKVVLLFEPTKKMLDLMINKYPSKVEIEKIGE